MSDVQLQANVLRKLITGKYAAVAANASTHIPYLRHVDASSVVCGDGHVLQVVQLEGLPYETVSELERALEKDLRSAALQNVGKPSVALWFHMIRREEPRFPEGRFKNAFAASLNKAWATKCSAQRVFRNDLYLTIVRRGPTVSVKGLAGLLDTLTGGKREAEARAEWEQEARDELRDTVAEVVKALSKYAPRVLSVAEAPSGALVSEPLTLFGYLVNGDWREVPVLMASVRDYLQLNRISFTTDTVEIQGSDDSVRLGAMLGIHEYPPATQSSMLDELLNMPRELVLTQSFQFIDRHSAITAIGLRQGHFRQAEDHSEDLADDLSQARQDLSGGRMGWGNHHLSVLVWGRSHRELRDGVAAVKSFFSGLQIPVKRERANLEAAFWAQLPGNVGYVARQAPISSANMAALANFHASPTDSVGGHWWGPAVTALRTAAGTPYFFSWHVGDLGNTTVIGRTGSGKSTLVGFLICQSLRFEPEPTVVIFDAKRGLEILVRALGGTYTIIRRGVPTDWNPMQLEPTGEHRAFLLDLLAICAELKPADSSSVEHRLQLKRALEQMYELERHEWRIGSLCAFLPPGELKNRMSAWHSGGEYAWLFDNPTDSMQMSSGIVGFDFTDVLNRQPADAAAQAYVFFQVTRFIRHGRVIFLIDEDRFLSSSESMSHRVEVFSNTIRKEGGLIIRATQSESHGLASKQARSLIDGAANTIVFPSKSLDPTVLEHDYGLSKHEISILRDDLPRRGPGYFLLRRGSRSVICELNLAGMEDAIAVLSGRKESVALCEAIRAELGTDNPEVWLPAFLHRVKEVR